MFNYPVTAALIGTGFNTFILGAILILSWYRFFATPQPGQDDLSEDDYRDPFAHDAASQPEEEDLEEENVLGDNIEKVSKEDSEEDHDTLSDADSLKMQKLQD